MRAASWTTPLIYWGFWPAAVIVLCQIEASRWLARDCPPRIIAVAVAGVLAMYGLDRWAERRCLARTANRHRAGLAWRWPIAAVALLLGLYGLPRFNFHEWRWLAILAAAGLMYLALTVNLWKVPPSLKELTGAFCFAAVVWGPFPEWAGAPLGPFALMAAANFLWSGHQDRGRDQANRLRSLAVAAPRLNLWLARAFALAAAAWLALDSHWASPFCWTSALHAVWPARPSGPPIDLAFAPMLWVVASH